MEFRKATQADLDYVRQNPYEGSVDKYPYIEVPDNNCYAAIYEDELVAVGGLTITWEGVGVGALWLLLTAQCKKDGIHGIRALDAIQEKTNYLIESNGLWRAEATVRVDFPQAIAMMEFLGFQKEGTRRMYFPDKTDGYLFSRIIL
jgi:hypothetical protein